MKKAQKHERVARLREELAGISGLVVAEQHGLSVAETQALRAELRAENAQLRVVKNTLARLSVQGTEMEVVSAQLLGPNVFAFGPEPIGPAKVMAKFAKDNDKLVIKAGVLRGKLLDAAQVQELAKLPSREELQAKLLGLFVAVPGKFVRQLNAAPSSFVRMLAARQEQLEGVQA